jgi:hypothetical protein
MIVENLVKLYVKDIVSCVLSDKHLQAIEKVPIPNSTVSRRI